MWKHVGRAPRVGRWPAIGVARRFAGTASAMSAAAASARWCRRPSSSPTTAGQIIKTPTWKTPDVPLYLFLGGLAGASAVLAEGAALTGRPALRARRPARRGRRARRPARSPWSTTSAGRSGSCNMLRVFKPTSPLSVGSFILAPFSALAGARPRPPRSPAGCPRLGRLAGRRRRARSAPPLATYTAALLANTAVPGLARGAPRAAVRVRRVRRRPPPAGWRWLLTPVAQAGPARRMAWPAPPSRSPPPSADRARLGMVGEPYQPGPARAR